MSERKVLNKYFPPDFDPSKITRRKRDPNAGVKQQVIRLMLPFSLRCNSCGEYIYKGKKFNARKEEVKDETYLGIKIFRFYIKCIQCSSEITFKTDPKNTDYVCEHGASRNFEVWRSDGGAENSEETMDERLDRIEQEMAVDPMAALENQTTDAKVEMDVLDALQDIRTRNARTERADVNAVLDRVNSKPDEEYLSAEARAELEQKRREEAEDEAEVRRVFGKIHNGGRPANPGFSNGLTSIELDEDVDPSEAMPDAPSAGPEASGSGSQSPAPSSNSAAGPSVKRRLEKTEPDALSLLSEQQRKLNQSAGSMPPPPLSKKKRNEAMANKLGIKRKT